MSYQLPNDNILKELFRQSKVIAVVGLSKDETKPSYRVASYLKQQGYRVIPVNPTIDELLGEKSYPSLTDIPEQVDIIDVFRPSDAIPPIAAQAASMVPRCLWLQLGITHPSAEEVAAKVPQMTLVMDRCLMVEHRRLMGGKQ